MTKFPKHSGKKCYLAKSSDFTASTSKKPQVQPATLLNRVDGIQDIISPEQVYKAMCFFFRENLQAHLHNCITEQRGPLSHRGQAPNWTVILTVISGQCLRQQFLNYCGPECHNQMANLLCSALIILKSNLLKMNPRYLYFQ